MANTPWNLKPFERIDYTGFDAKPFPNGDAPLYGQCENYTLVIGAEQGELFDDFNLGDGIDGGDAVLVFNTTHFKSAQEAINAMVGLAECLLGDQEPITPNPND